MRPTVYADDLVSGVTHDLGEHVVSLEDLLDFSRRWDPQDFHVEQTAAGYFEGAIASGLHSMAILQRLSVLGVYRDWAVLAGRRIRDVEFRAPVRAGARLRGSMTIASVQPTDRDRSLVTVTMSLATHDEVVLTSTHELYVFRRPDAVLTTPSTH